MVIIAFPVLDRNKSKEWGLHKINASYTNHLQLTHIKSHHVDLRIHMIENGMPPMWISNFKWPTTLDQSKSKTFSLEKWKCSMVCKKVPAELRSKNNDGKPLVVLNHLRLKLYFTNSHLQPHNTSWCGHMNIQISFFWKNIIFTYNFMPTIGTPGWKWLIRLRARFEWTLCFVWTQVINSVCWSECGTKRLQEHLLEDRWEGLQPDVVFGCLVSHWKVSQQLDSTTNS